MQVLIHKWKKSSNYTRIENEMLRDKSLSLKAKGLMALVMSFPPKWDLTVAGLSTILPESKLTINAILKELIAVGYVIRKRAKFPNGQFLGWHYTFYETLSLRDEYAKEGKCLPR